MTDRQPELVLFLFLLVILFTLGLLCKYLMEKYQETFEKRRLARMKKHVDEHYAKHNEN